MKVIAEYIFRDLDNGEFWIDLTLDRKPHGSLGPFDTPEARQRALDDLLDMTRALGAKDLPLGVQ